MKMEGIRTMMKVFLGPEGITREGMRQVFGLQLFDPATLTEQTLSIMFWMLVVQSAAGLFPALYVWTWPPTYLWGWVVVIAFCGTFSHYCMARAMLHADAGLSPTEWQASTYPDPLRKMITVIHDGVDTAVMAPTPEARFTLPNGVVVKPGDEVLTFVNRNLEPYRGYHIFMRALPAVLAARPNAQVVIVGGDEVSYGAAPKGEKGWKERFLSEVRDQLDMSRVHFMGKVPYPNFVALMQVSRAHAYLTYPFVLSWSMIEAMAAGCHIIGSATKPVMEALEHGKTGTLVDFFDVPGWSAALIDALAHPDRYLALRQAARQRALERYDLRSNCLPRMVDFVESFAPQR